MKRLLLILLAILLIGGGVGYYLWNKPHDKIENHNVEQVDAMALINAFETDEKAATEKYLNKALEVKGIPYEITENIDGNTVLFFSEDGFTGVQCTLREKNNTVNTTDPVVVQGFCNGNTSVVLLADCIIKTD